MKEVWKEISGHSNYAISNNGRVKKLAASYTKKVGDIIKSHRCGGRGRRNYLAVPLDYSKRFYIHRLVYSAFCGRIPSGFEINHKDGNGLNNRIENLECVTRKENCRHATVNGLVAFGERVGTSKLKPEDVLAMRSIYKQSKIRFKDLGGLFGVSGATSYRAVRGQSWARL